MNVKAIAITVRGKVQRVGYRNFVQRNTKSLGIKGFVRNMADGSVYIEASGQEESLNELIGLCRTGPYHASVESMEVRNLDIKHCEDFHIKG